MRAGIVLSLVLLASCASSPETSVECLPGIVTTPEADDDYYVEVTEEYRLSDEGAWPWEMCVDNCGTFYGDRCGDDLGYDHCLRDCAYGMLGTPAACWWLWVDWVLTVREDGRFACEGGGEYPTFEPWCEDEYRAWQACWFEHA